MAGKSPATSDAATSTLCSEQRLTLAQLRVAACFSLWLLTAGWMELGCHRPCSAHNGGRRCGGTVPRAASEGLVRVTHLPRARSSRGSSPWGSSCPLAAGTSTGLQDKGETASGGRGGDAALRQVGRRTVLLGASALGRD